MPHIKFEFDPASRRLPPLESDVTMGSDSVVNYCEGIGAIAGDSFFLFLMGGLLALSAERYTPVMRAEASADFEGISSAKRSFLRETRGMSGTPRLVARSREVFCSTGIIASLCSRILRPERDISWLRDLAEYLDMDLEEWRRQAKKRFGLS